LSLSPSNIRVHFSGGRASPRTSRSITKVWSSCQVPLTASTRGKLSIRLFRRGGLPFFRWPGRLCCVPCWRSSVANGDSDGECAECSRRKAQSLIPYIAYPKLYRANCQIRARFLPLLVQLSYQH
jgi:hypothetical protein